MTRIDESAHICGGAHYAHQFCLREKQVMLSINARDAWARSIELKQRKEKSMERVLELCMRHITKSTNMQQTSCMFDIPEFMIGYPIYNLNDCIAYVYHDLTARGFKIVYLFPKVFIISWDMTEQEITPSRHVTHTIENRTTRRVTIPQ